MGMHFGLIAVKASTAEFRAALPDISPQLDIVAAAENFANAESIWSWKQANERFVSATSWTRENPGIVVYLLSQDGPWAVLLDFEYVLASDEAVLQKLSERFGRAISFVTETTGGCAYFWCYDSGNLRRTLQHVNGENSHSGEPLAEEEGIDVDNYYMEETVQLMRSFGLTDSENQPIVATACALAIIDRTDYSEVAGAAPKPPSIQATKPWWKFW